MKFEVRSPSEGSARVKLNFDFSDLQSDNLEEQKSFRRPLFPTVNENYINFYVLDGRFRSRLVPRGGQQAVASDCE
eukprot:scaffold535469_cov23-Prasinocladus_malaysianus.AAC.1